MKRNKKQKEYQAGRIAPIVRFVAQGYITWIQKNTTLNEGAKIPDEASVIQVLKETYPGLAHKERCYNCDASMEIKRFTMDAPNVALLTAMAREVAMRMKRGLSFHEANKVHVQTLGLYNSRECRTTISRYFGLIAKVENKKGTHDREAGWLITRRGWDFLKGKPVPKYVHAIRNKIVERPSDTITISEIPLKGDGKTAMDRWVEVAGILPDQEPLL